MEKKDVIEKLAELEHKQWAEWSKNIAETEKISPERMERWSKLWTPYDKLPEEMKEEDRKWARNVFDLLFSLPKKCDSCGKDIYKAVNSKGVSWLISMADGMFDNICMGCVVREIELKQMENMVKE